MNRILTNLLFLYVLIQGTQTLRTYTKEDMITFREEVKEMFYHAYNSYLKYAYPYDELRPLSCDGVDTYGSYSLTLIDALDTLAIMGNYTEFQRVTDILTAKDNFDSNINVSVFETNIRIIGGLLSAHLLSHRAGVKLEPGWPCNGPLLRLAEDVANRLIIAFNTPTGMPYGTINLRHGIPPGETTVTCTAGIGTFILEFGTLSRLTGDPLYEEVAMNALYALYHHQSQIGLFGNHIDVATGRWTAQDAGIGSGVDSYFEYLVKGSILFQKPELLEMFHEARKGIDKYLKRDDWYLWVSMTKGQVTIPVFQSLEAYWPGVLSLIGETSSAMKTLHNYHQVWQQYGFTPEFYNILQTEAGTNRENYPLRPELIESVMYLYRATGDPYLIEVGVDILKSIQHSARTPCGYATIKDVRDHRKEDRMESFFLAETTKYLYLLFDTDNFIHNQGEHGTIIDTPNGECVIEAGGYVFNTEAHPIDPSALYCCHEVPHQRLFDFDQLKNNKKKLRGQPIRGTEERSEELDEENNEVPDFMEEKNIEMDVETVTDSTENYKVDDNEKLFSKTDDVDKENVDADTTEANITGKEKSSDDNTKFIRMIKNIIPPTPRQKFDPQKMLERFRYENKYPVNSSWATNYELLSCKAQPFLQKMSLYGEFFNK
ncbi:er degradation-enhancing alpha-mannosidase-like protein 2 [Holotrichia oblita]|uniref:Er degradation-enhancing alpha-mannosidase-like protein 2 n=1 Tax=Holotrichia oblita TaxID=644536 RepID=A0ACB9T715_HOLOL|nr:er degradation-enhancing alpha-mannosidase-like protein 2 [Holotrichia oblita]